MKIKMANETVGNIVKIGGAVLLYGLAHMASRTSVKDIVDEFRYRGDVSYSDVVGVIMDCDMLDSNKNKAMELLKKNGNTEYYKTIIKIIKSNMLDSSKVKAIATLNGEEA